MTAAAPNRFAVGAGRTRPPHQPKELACPHCGAGIELPDERGRVVVCTHCRSEIELSDTEARAVGAVGEAPDGFHLEIGHAFNWEGVRYEVVGRTMRHDVGEPDHQTFGYYLYNPRHPSLWLSCYRGNWTLGRRTRVMAQGSVWKLLEGAEITTHDGARWRLLERGTSVLAYVDGALPWLAKVGDQNRQAEFAAADGSAARYEVEKNPTGEIEQSQARKLTPEEIEAATEGLVSGAAAIDVEALRAKWGTSPRLRAAGKIWLVFAAVALVTATVLTIQGRPMLREKIPPKGGLVGPIEVDQPNTVLEIEIDQRFVKDGWSYVEGEVLDEDENYLFGFGEELWAESGYDDGAWHEEKNDYDLYVTIPDPGKYYLDFAAQAGPQAPTSTATQPQDIGRDIRVSVENKPGSALPFWLAGALGAIVGLLMWELATGRIRKTLGEIEWSD